MFPGQPPFDQIMTYRIELKGRLEMDWSAWMDHLAVTYRNEDAYACITVLTGPIRDQVELHGLLARIRDLGLTILSMRCLGMAGDIPQPGGDDSAAALPQGEES